MVSGEPRSGVHGRARRWLRGFVRSLRCYGRHWQQRPGDAFTEAYALSVSHRAPLLYLVVVFNTLLVASCFYGTAPRLLVLMGPVLSLVAVQRAWHWMPDKVAGRPVERLRSDLDGMQRLGGWAALLFVAWSLGLYPYGDPGQRELLHFVIAVTMFSAVLGMANSPQTALRLGTAFNLP